MRFKWMSAILAVQVRLPLIRIEFVFVFQIWYCELCVKKPMRGRQKTLFWFLFLFIIALPPARPLFLIVLHNGVKKVHVIKAWFVTWNRNGDELMGESRFTCGISNLHKVAAMFWNIISVIWDVWQGFEYASDLFYLKLKKKILFCLICHS